MTFKTAGSNKGALFTLRSLEEHQPAFRGISTLTWNPHSYTPLSSNVRRRPHTIDIKKSELLIDQCETCPGHIAIAIQGGRALVLFDISLTSPNLISHDGTTQEQIFNGLSDTEWEQLVRFLHTSDEVFIPSLLALRTVDSVIARMQFAYLPYENEMAGSNHAPSKTDIDAFSINRNNVNKPNGTHTSEDTNRSTKDHKDQTAIYANCANLPLDRQLVLIVTQTNGSFLLWQWNTATDKWNFISRGVLPFLASKWISPSKAPTVPERHIYTSTYSSSLGIMVWTEGISSHTAGVFSCQLPGLYTASPISSVVSCDKGILIPLQFPVSDKHELLLGQHGVFIHNITKQVLHYWSFIRNSLTVVWNTQFYRSVKAAPPNISIKSLHVHPNDGRLMIVTSQGDILVYDETGDNSSQQNNYDLDEVYLPAIKLSPVLVKETFICRLQHEVSSFASSNEIPSLPLVADLSISDIAHGVFFRDYLIVLSSSSILDLDSHSSQSTSTLAHIFHIPSGICIDRMELNINLSAIQYISVSRYGFGSTGVVIMCTTQLYYIQSGALSSHIDSITTATPYEDEQNRALYASDSFFPSSSTFVAITPSLTFHSQTFAQSLISPLNRSPSIASSNIPGVPYAYTSDIASELTKCWLDSATALYQQAIVERLLSGMNAQHACESIPMELKPFHKIMVTSHREIPSICHTPLEFSNSTTSSPVKLSAEPDSSNITNPLHSNTVHRHFISQNLPLDSHQLPITTWLESVMPVIQSPSIALAMLTAPTFLHYQNGHIADIEYEKAILHYLNSFLLRMSPVLPRHEALSNNALEIHKKETSSFLLNGLAKLEECFNHYTPLNTSLLSHLSSYYSLLVYLGRLHEQRSNSAGKSEDVAPIDLRLPLIDVPINNFSSPVLLSPHSVDDQLRTAFANFAAQIPISKDRSLQSLFFYEARATWQYLITIMGFNDLPEVKEDMQEWMDIDIPTTSVTPNVLLLNEEIKIKKELGVYGEDVSLPASTFTIHHTNSFYYFEMLCSLFDRFAPKQIIAFVLTLAELKTTKEELPNSKGNPNTFKKNPLFQKPILTTEAMSYYDRAFRALPMHVSYDTDDEDTQNDTARVRAMRLQRTMVRCWLLRKSGRIVEAVLYRLHIAKTDCMDDHVARAIHQEAAFDLAMKTIETVGAQPNDSLINRQLKEDFMAIRAELAYHLLVYSVQSITTPSFNLKQATSNPPRKPLFSQRSSYDANSILLSNCIDDVDFDHRQIALLSPRYSVFHFMEYLRLHLEGRMEEPEDDEDEDFSSKPLKPLCSSPSLYSPSHSRSFSASPSFDVASSSFRQASFNSLSFRKSSFAVESPTLSTSSSNDHAPDVVPILTQEATLPDIPLGRIRPQLLRFATSSFSATTPTYKLSTKITW